MHTAISDTVDKIFNSHKIKFGIMEILFRDVEVKEAIHTVNIFINIESIYHLFHNQYVEDSIIAMDKKELSQFHSCVISNTLNLAAHYRWFFTKNKISTNIVFYMNQYSKYIHQNNFIHNKKYRDKYVYNYTDNPNYEGINLIMKSVLKALDNIVDYIDGVYFVSSDRIESSLIPMVMIEDKLLKGQINLMVTRDDYDLQYVNKKFLVMYPKGDESCIVTKDNLFNVIQQKYEFSNDYKLPSYLFSFILAVVGDKRRSIGKIKGVGWSTIYKNLTKLFKKMDISEEEYISFEQLALAIKEDPTAPESNREKVISNYMCIDLDRQYAMVSEAQKLSIERQILDRYEADALKKLNAKYFEDFPINIIELNQYTSRKKTLF